VYEFGRVFTLVGADGTTVIFNDGLSGLWLGDVAGFDSPNIRLNVATCRSRSTSSTPH
jgi:hypothetical protein